MKCFAVYSDKIEGRIDPSSYDSIRLEALKKVKSSTYDKLPLKDVANFKKELVTTNRGNLTYLGLENVESNTGLFIPSYELKKSFGTALKFQKGNVLFPKLRPYLNKVHFAQFDGICSTEFNILAPNKCSDYYLFAFLNSRLVVNQTSCLMTGNTLPRLQTEDIENLLIPLPSLEIQNKVTELMQSAYEQKKQKASDAQKLLDSIDDYVLDELGIKLPELKDKKCYVVNSDDIENRLDPSYYQPKFSEIEKAFKKSGIKLESLKNFVTKIHYGISIKNVYVDEGIPLIRICNLWPNKIDLSDVIRLPESMRKNIGNGFVYKGDILISRSGSVGIVSVVPKEADGFAFGSFMIKFCLNDKINKEYVSIWLNNKLATLLTQREKIGAIQGNITIPTIENFKIPIPSLSAQNKIVDEVKKRMTKAEKLKEEAENVLAQAKGKVEKIILD